MKKPTVALYDIIDAFELQSDSFRSFVNKKTGQIIHLIEGEEFADIEEELEENPNPVDFIPLPDTWEDKEQVIREEFCDSIEEQKLQEALRSAIKEKGAFGRFETTLDSYDMSDQWFDFRYDHLEKMAIDFCNAHHLAYTAE